MKGRNLLSCGIKRRSINMCNLTNIMYYSSLNYLYKSSNGIVSSRNRDNSTPPSFSSSLRPEDCSWSQYLAGLGSMGKLADHFGDGETDRHHYPIVKGDTVNVHDLLFTKYRDYLVRYNDNKKVKAAQLAGKVIVLFFVPVTNDNDRIRKATSCLKEKYKFLLPRNILEVVLVAYEDKDTPHSENIFNCIFSRMPWTAIPFSDTSSIDRLVRLFNVHRSGDKSEAVVIDSTGLVLPNMGCTCRLFSKYIELGFPFSKEMIEYLELQDYRTPKKSYLKALLGTRERDYVISNKGDKVPIDSLEGKVVALFFYEEGSTPDSLTAKIKMAYEEFAQKKSMFEVVLIYLNDTFKTFGCTSEKSYHEKFKTMPWLALPFEDPQQDRELRRFFPYPWSGLSSEYGLEPEKAPTLVIVGPYGKFTEPWGAQIIGKFSLSSYPFTRERVAMLYTEKVRELKLEMLWDRSTIFTGKDGSKVRFSQLVGKRIILFNEGNEEEGNYHRTKVVNFLILLKQRYFKMKDTGNEFEVIYITKSEKESPYKEHIADVPWFVSLSSELLPIDLNSYCCYCPPKATTTCLHRRSSVLAFDEDGRVVRKSLELSFNDVNFPFYVGGMQREAFSDLNEFYGWWELDMDFEGLLINPYYKNECLSMLR